MAITLFLCQIAHPTIGKGERMGRSEPWWLLEQVAKAEVLRLESSSRLEHFKALDFFELWVFFSWVGLESLTFLFPWMVGWVEGEPSS